MAKNAHGVIFIHSTPAALCPHIAWALGAVLNTQVAIQWRDQPAERGTVRAELAWEGPAGASAAITSALRNCQRVRFEVTEEAGRDAEGQRYSYTPRLGIFHAMTASNGDIVVPEQRLRSVMATCTPADISEAIDDLLGGPWDEELEIFRHAGEGESVRWMYRAS